MLDRALIALASELGILTRWTDGDGNLHEPAPAAIRALVGALGYACASAGQIAESRARVARLGDRRLLPPLLTATAGKPIPLDRSVDAGRVFRIELENGEPIDGRLSNSGALPPVRSPGYHRLEIGEESCTIAVAPPRCFSLSDIQTERAKRWGLAAQIYSLRRDGDGGIGDFGALAELAELAGAAGADALAMSPVHAMFSAAPERRSPYSPSSRLFLNALLIDVRERFADAEIAAAAAAIGLDAAPHLETAATIDWPASARRKLALMRELYRRAGERKDSALVEFDEFRARGGEALRSHALFEVLHARYREQGLDDWRDWPEIDSEPVGSAGDEDELGFHMFLQWLAARGLAQAQRRARGAGMDIGLIADLAVGSDPAGSDAWRLSDELLRGLTVGAPPDLFNERGQDWGLTTFSPFALRANGYAGFIAMLRAAMRHGGGLRIDHVMGLMRLWLVPHGGTSLDGAYLMYPMQDLVRLVALESLRHRCIVIGEDLGVVPEGFREQMRRAGMLGMDILWFMRGKRYVAPSRWHRQAVAMTTTHDLPTLSSWWRGTDIDVREGIDLIAGAAAARERDARVRDRAALARAIRAAFARSTLSPQSDAGAFVEEAIGFVGASRCELALLPLEDVFALDAQPNVPGTIDDHPNWRRRMPGPVDRLLESGRARARLQRMANARAAS